MHDGILTSQNLNLHTATLSFIACEAIILTPQTSDFRWYARMLPTTTLPQHLMSGCKLFVCLIVLGVVATCQRTTCGQDLNPSHRVIEGMPQDLSSLYSQLNLLKQLQQLGQIDIQELPLGNQNPATGKNPLENLDPELMKQLQKAMEHMSQQSSGPNSTQSNTGKQNGPSDPTSSVKRDPSATQNAFDPRQLPQNEEEQQQQALESMLKALSERTGMPLDEMLKQAQRQPGSNSQIGKEANDQIDSSDTADKPRSNSLDNPRIKPARRPDRPVPREQDALQNQGPSTANNSLPEMSSNPGNAGNQQSTGSSSSTDPEDITEFKSDILKQLDRLTNRNPGENNSSQSAEDSAKIAELRELLKSRSTDQPARKSATSQPSDLDEAGKSVLEELRESPAGVREKLRSIMDYAKQQSQNPAGQTAAEQGESAGGIAESTAPAGLKSALTKALESTAKQMFEEAENLPKGNTPKPSPQVPSPRANKQESRFKSWEKATTAMLSSISQAPVPDSNSPANAPQRPPSATEPRTWQDFPWMPLLALFVSATLAYLALLLIRERKTYALNAAAIKALPDEMTNRADIIHAFHTIVGRTIAPTENWWPHRRAAEAVGNSSPKVKFVMNSLCSVYESARYLPEDYTLSVQQLETARSAVAAFKAEA